MRRLLLLFIIFLFGVQAHASLNEIKFVQVTDVHYAVGNDVAKNALKNTISDINNQKGVSFVVFTGDNIDRPDPVALEEFIKFANKLNVPYYLVIGNHDVYRGGGMDKHRYLEIIRKNNFGFNKRQPNYVFKKGKFVFLVVDGAKEIIPGPAGYYREDTLQWVDKQLSKYKKNPVVIFQHFPLVEPRRVRSHTTYKAEEYLAILAKHNNVAAVVSGHYHFNAESMLNGVYHINSPSLLADPHTYKIITIVTTRGFSPMIYTQLREVR